MGKFTRAGALTIRQYYHMAEGDENREPLTERPHQGVARNCGINRKEMQDQALEVKVK